jgi:hypothetical protein
VSTTIFGAVIQTLGSAGPPAATVSNPSQNGAIHGRPPKTGPFIAPAPEAPVLPLDIPDAAAPLATPESALPLAPPDGAPDIPVIPMPLPAPLDEPLPAVPMGDPLPPPVPEIAPDPLPELTPAEGPPPELAAQAAHTTNKRTGGGQLATLNRPFMLAKHTVRAAPTPVRKPTATRLQCQNRFPL